MRDDMEKTGPNLTWLFVVGAVLIALFIGGFTRALCMSEAPAWESQSKWR